MTSRTVFLKVSAEEVIAKHNSIILFNYASKLFLTAIPNMPKATWRLGFDV